MEPRWEEIQSFTQVSIAVITRVAFYAARVENYLTNKPVCHNGRKESMQSFARGSGTCSRNSKNIYAKNETKKLYLCISPSHRYLFDLYMKMSFFAVDTETFLNSLREKEKENVHCRKKCKAFLTEWLHIIMLITFMLWVFLRQLDFCFTIDL